MNYLYRIDTHRSLKIIQREGFHCGAFSRMDNCAELEQAQKEGLKVPTIDLIGKPTIYFFSEFTDAVKWLDKLKVYDFITRYPTSIPSLSNDDFIFPDGAMGTSAVYVIFKELKANDIAIRSADIEMLVKSKWRPLKKINFDKIKKSNPGKTITKERVPKKNAWMKKVIVT